ncbi:MAG TPA: hypothetical protein VFR31_12050 [Thermoanaerobaculia bacterium]|nr:hypothetical protein [Thermoanaerobaculia bacterium]
MKRTVCFVFILAAVLALNVPAVEAQTTQPGLFFTIVNNCTTSVSGFAVGDKLCLLQVGTATFTRAIFQGTMAPGQQQFAMACAGKDGNGSVIFVPPAGTSIQAVVVAVKPNQKVNIPQTFCGKAAAPEGLFQHKK